MTHPNDPYYDPDSITHDRRIATASRFRTTGEWEYTLKPGFTYKGQATFRVPGVMTWFDIAPFVLENDPNGSDGPS